jgi:hypothetical protein
MVKDTAGRTTRVAIYDEESPWKTQAKSSVSVTFRVCYLFVLYWVLVLRIAPKIAHGCATRVMVIWGTVV